MRALTVIVALAMIIWTSAAGTTSSDASALCAFYALISAVGKTRLVNWCSGSMNPCGSGSTSWTGVTCKNSRVIKILLPSTTSLGGGSLPSQLGGLDALTYLVVQGGSISGSIPTELGLLTGLAYLYLAANSLTGSIPTQIGGLTGITHLTLNTNGLSGSVPIEIGLLTRLTYLDLSVNSLSGSIPSQIGGLTGLTTLALSTNSIYGSVPSQIGILTKLTYLGLDNTALVGALPASMCLLPIAVTLNVIGVSISCFPACLLAYSGFSHDAAVGACAPSAAPSPAPSSPPTMQPSATPTAPSAKPSPLPTLSPSVVPTVMPSVLPTVVRTPSPSSRLPSTVPSALPTVAAPTTLPTSLPSIRSPTTYPTVFPTTKPSSSPPPTTFPSMYPTTTKTKAPSSIPTAAPSALATSALPSQAPTPLPSPRPTMARPSPAPSCAPTVFPMVLPSANPTMKYDVPTAIPTALPTQPSPAPSDAPSPSPTAKPSNPPTAAPSPLPSSQPTLSPSESNPTARPTPSPSLEPTIPPTIKPTSRPSPLPTASPSPRPSAGPTQEPSNPRPTAQPTPLPSADPTTPPSFLPTGQPTRRPSAQPSRQPNSIPSGQPSKQPTRQPSAQPSSTPSAQPTINPTVGQCRVGHAITQVTIGGASGNSSARVKDKCVPCAVGTYSATLDRRWPCLPCPIGTLNSLPGQLVCASAPLGSFSSSTGLSMASLCPRGSFSNAPGATRCFPCTAGHYSSYGASDCLPCPQSSFNANAGAGSCTKCPPGKLTPLPGSVSALQCLSPVNNFVLGWLALIVSAVIAALYIIEGRFGYAAFIRRERVVSRQAKKFNDFSDTLAKEEGVYWKKESEKKIKGELKQEIKERREVHLMQDSEKTRHKIYEWIKRCGLALWDLSVTLLLFFPLSLILSMLFTVVIFCAFLMSVFFQSLIIYRQSSTLFHLIEYRQAVTAVTDAIIAALRGIPTIPPWVLDTIKFLLGSVLELFDYLNVLKIDLSGIGVTCTGASAPFQLLLNIFVLGCIIMIIQSDIQLFRTMSFKNTLDKCLGHLLTREYRREKLQDKKDRMHGKALKTEAPPGDKVCDKVCGCWAGDAPQLTWWETLRFLEQYVGNILFVCVCHLATFCISFQSVLQYTLALVQVSVFASDHHLHSYTESCNQVAGAENFDRILATSSSILAYLLVLPVVYEVSKVLAPIEPKEKQAQLSEGTPPRPSEIGASERDTEMFMLPPTPGMPLSDVYHEIFLRVEMLTLSWSAAAMWVRFLLTVFSPDLLLAHSTKGLLRVLQNTMGMKSKQNVIDTCCVKVRKIDAESPASTNVRFCNATTATSLPPPVARSGKVSSVRLSEFSPPIRLSKIFDREITSSPPEAASSCSSPHDKRTNKLLELEKNYNSGPSCARRSYIFLFRVYCLLANAAVSLGGYCLEYIKTVLFVVRPLNSTETESAEAIKWNDDKKESCLPSYLELLQIEAYILFNWESLNPEKLQTGSYPWVGYFLCLVLFIVPVGHFTPRGRGCWVLVLRKILTFLFCSLGYWDAHATAVYAIEEKVKGLAPEGAGEGEQNIQDCVKSPMHPETKEEIAAFALRGNAAAKLTALKKGDKEPKAPWCTLLNPFMSRFVNNAPKEAKEDVEKFKTHEACLSATIGLRAILLQIFPYCSVLSVFIIATASCPMLVRVDGESDLHRRINPYFIKNGYLRAVKLEASLSEYSQRQWMMRLSGLTIFLIESRAIQFIFQSYLVILALYILLAPLNGLVIASIFIMLLPMSMAYSLRIICTLGRALNIKDVHNIGRESDDNEIIRRVVDEWLKIKLEEIKQEDDRGDIEMTDQIVYGDFLKGLEDETIKAQDDLQDMYQNCITDMAWAREDNIRSIQKQQNSSMFERLKSVYFDDIPPGAKERHIAPSSETNALIVDLLNRLAEMGDNSKVGILENAFAEADANKNGTIDKGEFKNVLEALQVTATDRAINAIYAFYDGDGNAGLDYREFLQMLVQEDVHGSSASKVPPLPHRRTVSKIASTLAVKGNTNPMYVSEAVGPNKYQEPASNGINKVPTRKGSIMLTSIEKIPGNPLTTRKWGIHGGGPAPGVSNNRLDPGTPIEAASL